MLVAKVLMMLGVLVAAGAFVVTIVAMFRKRWEWAHLDAGVVLLALAIAGVGAGALSASASTAVTYALVTFFVGGMLYYFGKRMRLEGRGRPGR